MMASEWVDLSSKGVSDSHGETFSQLTCTESGIHFAIKMALVVNVLKGFCGWYCLK